MVWQRVKFFLWLGSIPWSESLDFYWSQTCFSTKPQFSKWHHHSPSRFGQEPKNHLWFLPHSLCVIHLQVILDQPSKYIHFRPHLLLLPTALVQATFFCLDTSNTFSQAFLPPFPHTVHYSCNRQSDLLRTQCLCITFRINSESLCGPIRGPTQSDSHRPLLHTCCPPCSSHLHHTDLLAIRVRSKLIASSGPFYLLLHCLACSP